MLLLIIILVYWYRWLGRFGDLGISSLLTARLLCWWPVSLSQEALLAEVDTMADRQETSLSALDPVQRRQ